MEEKNKQSLVSFNDMQKLSEIFYKSNLFSDVKSEAQALVKIMAGREISMPPFLSMKKIYIIEARGKTEITTASEIMASLIRTSNKYDYKEIKSTNSECEIEFLRKDSEGEWESLGTELYTIEDAKRAGLLTKDNWQKNPKFMLWCRCIAFGRKKHCPDVGTGMLTTEEVIDMQDVADIDKMKKVEGIAKEGEPEKKSAEIPEDIQKLFNELEIRKAKQEALITSYREKYGITNANEKLKERLEKEKLNKEQGFDEKAKTIKILQGKIGMKDEEYRKDMKEFFKNPNLDSSKKLSDKQKDEYIAYQTEILNKKLDKEIAKEEKNDSKN